MSAELQVRKDKGEIRCLLLSKSTKGTARFNVPIRRKNCFQNKCIADEFEVQDRYILEQKNCDSGSAPLFPPNCHTREKLKTLSCRGSNQSTRASLVCIWFKSGVPSQMKLGVPSQMKLGLSQYVIGTFHYVRGNHRASWNIRNQKTSFLNHYTSWKITSSPTRNNSFQYASGRRAYSIPCINIRN